MAMADDVSHCSQIFEKVQFNFGKLAQFATNAKFFEKLILAFEADMDRPRVENVTFWRAN